MNNVRATISQTTITMKYKGYTVYVKKETDNLLFEEAKTILKSKDEEKIKTMFLDIKEKLEKFTNQIFTVENEQLFLKNDTTPIPELLAEKLLQLENQKEDFMPLIRFWKKLKRNPSQDSVNQLYGFLVHNNIPITETGDIVTEKGVSQLTGGLPEELVDDHSGTVDNSIGSEVTIARDKVDPDPERTCSSGLHVGAPDFVRNHWNSSIIVQCVVNPKDVVAVPVDYKNTKMRVCRYIVAGYSPKTLSSKLIFKLEDFVTTPPQEVLEVIKEKSGKGETKKKKNKDKVVTKKSKKKDFVVPKKYINKAKKDIDKLSGRKIMDFVKEKTGVSMTYNPKSKKTIVKKAIEILSQHYELSE